MGVCLEFRAYGFWASMDQVSQLCSGPRAPSPASSYPSIKGEGQVGTVSKAATISRAIVLLLRGPVRHPSKFWCLFHHQLLVHTNPMSLLLGYVLLLGEGRQP